MYELDCPKPWKPEAQAPVGLLKKSSDTQVLDQDVDENATKAKKSVKFANIDDDEEF